MKPSFSPAAGLHAGAMGPTEAVEDRIRRLEREAAESARAEESLRRLCHELEQRVRELNCLCNISSLCGRTDLPVGEILQGVVDFIPSSFPHPRIAGARLTLRDKTVTTLYCAETPEKLSRAIAAHGGSAGLLEIFVREEADEGPAGWKVRHNAAGLLAAIADHVRRLAERPQAEGPPRESEPHYRALAEGSGLMVLHMDPHFTVRFANESAGRLFGCPRDALPGRNAADALLPQLRRRGAGEPGLFVVGQPPPAESFDFESAHTVEGGRGTWVRWRHTPIRDRDGRLMSRLCVGTDITEEKRLQEQLLRAHKSKAMHVIAEGIAHRFNNILAVVMGNAELALEDISKAGAMEKRLHEILGAAARAGDIVARLLKLTRAPQGERVPLDVEALVEDCLRGMGPAIPTEVRIETSFPGTFRILGDDAQVQEILIQLFQNALEAMEEKGGVLSVGATTAELDPGDAPLTAGMPPGPYVRIDVADSGKGIPRELLDRVFEPFVTTKGPDEGAGLGLSIARRLTENHGGSIRVQSRPGRGTRVRLLFPAFSAKSPTTACGETGGCDGRPSPCRSPGP